MKEIGRFLKWHWDKWSWGQRVYILGAGFFGAGLGKWFETGIVPWQIQVAFTIWGVILAKWFFWDSTIASWKTYKQEKADIFRKIEEGK